jgi:hypothetical protein
MKFLQNLERKFGRHAIRHLTLYIVSFYVIGYILYYMQSANNVPLLSYLSLDPGLIARGQIWRLFTWVLIPPSSLSIWTIVMLICYYQLGTMLERTWGDFLYDFYIFFGLIMTVIGVCVMYAVYPAFRTLITYSTAVGGYVVSTYYVSLSIFLGFAMTYPDQIMLFMFVIPVKIKYLAILDIAYLIYSIVRSGMPIVTTVLILCSLASTILFFFMMRSTGRAGRSQRKRQEDFRRAFNDNLRGNRTNQSTGGAQGSGGSRHTKIALHRCAVCGRTELDDPNLEFRFCSKCKGNYEYCSDHINNHKHVQ